MEIELLNKMADYLEKGPEGHFDMRQYQCCVIGHINRALGIADHPEWRAAYRVFGLDGPAACFCFGSQWSNCPKAAAARIRYVAQHGDAPHYTQWERFRVAPEAMVAPVAPEVVETQEQELLEEAFA